MGKFPFASCCCSCSRFSSSSPSTPPPSSQPSQQPVNAGPSTPSSSSQPSQQPAIAGPSTPSPSSQPSQQPSIAGPSTATTTDLESFLHKFNDISQLHDLILLIEEKLKIVSGEKNEEGSCSATSSYIQDGQTILEFVDTHIGRLSAKKDSIDGVSVETEKVLIDLLKGAGKIHWVGAALSVVGFVLARFNQMSKNKSECLQILKDMVNLGKQILELKEQIPEQKQKLNEAVECIVVGCSICTSQLADTKIFRFLTASVNAESLKDFQAKIDRLYNDIQLWGIIDIEKNVQKIAPESQELYAHQSAVGIASAQEEVIRRLDLNAQDTSTAVVVVHGFGGIGKTTLADAVYAQIALQSYKHCRIHMEQYCTKNDLKVLQEQILNGLFHQNVKLNNCDQGRGLIRSLSKKNLNQPLFLYIDNGLKKEDLKELLPADLGTWLPPKSRILVTTRNLRETDKLVDSNVKRQEYRVSPLPSSEGRKILLKKVPAYNDESNIKALLKLCDGVPLLLEIIGSQLGISIRNANNIEILEMIREGEKVEDEDISDRMVDYVYLRLSPRVKEAFLDITSSFYSFLSSQKVAYIVGEEEFKALEDASFVKTSESGYVIVHDIVQARGRKMSEQEGNRITDRQTLSECLKDKEKLRNLKGIYFDKQFEQPPIEINENHLNCMSNSLRVLRYESGSPIIFTKKCDKPFKQLRFVCIPHDIPDLPMKFEKLEHITFYEGPFIRGMSLYELPPSLRLMNITAYSENRDAYSRIPSEVTPPSSLEDLRFFHISTMKILPDGVEKLTKLNVLWILNCRKLRELPSKIGELSNLKYLSLDGCSSLEEWPSSFGDLSKLKTLSLYECSSKLKESLPDNIIKNCKYIEK